MNDRPDDASPNTKQPSRPGMMGDETEEQNLGQPGDPKARIKKEEVEEAFKKPKNEDNG